MDVDQVINLYHNKGLSSQEVGDQLGKTVWQVIKFMRKHSIPRRKASETHRLQFYRSPLSYNKKQRMTLKEKRLYEACLMLYWAEGVKAGKHTVDLANSDKDMVMLFLEMLRRVYKVDEHRLRVLLYCYENQNKDKLINYWSKKLDIPVDQFIKPYVRQDYNKNKKHKMPYGLVHIRYNDMRLFADIKKAISIIKNELLIQVS